MPLPVINVGDFASGDGTDETAVIQQAIGLVPLEGGILYFPPGTYGVGSAVPLVIEGRRCITLLGSYGLSVLQRLPGERAQDDGELTFDDGPGILRVEDCDDLTIRGLKFDANGWVAAGDNLRALVTVFRSRGVRIERNTALDGRPNESLAEVAEAGMEEEYEGPHAVAFGFFHHIPGAELLEEDLSRNIQVLDNDLQSLGIAAHHVQDVRISGNRILEARAHAIALGGEGVIDGAIHQRIEISDNQIEEAAGYGIVVADITEGIGGRIQDVRISRNRIRRLLDKRLQRGIVVGALRPHGPEEVDLVYDGIEVSGNSIELRGDAARAGLDQFVGIWFQVAEPVFEDPSELTLLGGDVRVDLMRNCVIRDNLVIRARSRFGGFGIVVHNFFRGVIAGNGVYDSSAGIDLRGVSCMNHVHDNRVEVVLGVEGQSAPYQLGESVGANWLSGNAVLGGTRRAFWPRAGLGRDRLVNGDLHLPDELGG